MNIFKKWGYLIFTSGLTASAVWACYWQTSKYFKSSEKWRVISSQLDRDEAIDLGELSNPSPFLYVKSNGTLSQQYLLINRARGQRLGYCVMRALKFVDLSGKRNQIVAFDGWIPDNADAKQKLMSTRVERQLRGLIRGGESTDYLASSFSKQDLAKEGITPFIDLKQLVREFGMEPTSLNTEYFVQLFKDIHDKEIYPSRSTKEDFQRPYLTPAKHRDYATFWACTSLVGLTAIIKVLRMR